MKINIQPAIFLAAFLIGLSACEFTPSEIPLTEIEKPSEIPPQILIDLKPEMEILRISGPTWISYSVETGIRGLYNIEFKFDNVGMASLYFESAGKVNAFINTDTIREGIGMHELEIFTYTATNSGSIADKTGIEQYLYRITWPVYLNKYAKDKFKLNDPEVFSDGITLSWPEYDYADFAKYELYWNRYTAQNGKVSISDPRQNSYCDKFYVEGIYCTYTLYLHLKDEDFRSDNVNFLRPIENPEVKVNEDRSVDINWVHSKNEENVQLYYIDVSVPVYGYSEEHEITDMADTSLRLSRRIGFGGDYKVRLRYIPKGFDNYYSTLETTGGISTFALGDSVPGFQTAFVIQGENSLILYKNGTCLKWNFLTGESSASVTFPSSPNVRIPDITGSPDGNYFGYFENKEFVIRRSSDLSAAGRLDVEAYDGSNFIVADVSISNNGLIATVSNNYLRIFDIGTGAKLLEKYFGDDHYLKEALISPDGKNIAIVANGYQERTNTLIYSSIDGGQLNETGRVNGVGNDYYAVTAFSPQTEQKFVVSRWKEMYSYVVEVRDSRTFELLHSVGIPSMFVPVVYDFTANRVISRYQSFPPEKYSYLTDMASGINRKIVQFTGREPLIFTEGTVYSGNGRSIVIDNFLLE